MSQAIQIFFSGLNWLCYLLAAILFVLAVWDGLRIEIGKPGDDGHVFLEVYAAKRLFK